MIKAKYTVFLKTLLDDPIVKPLIDSAMSTYPMYTQKTATPEYIPRYIPTREQLNKKILDHYKYNEIGFETPARFIDELEITLNEIMPYYCQLYYSADQDYNLLYNVDYTKTINVEREGEGQSTTGTTTTGSSETNGTDTSNTTSSMTNNHKDTKSSTPQSQLNIPANGIDTIDYADEVNFGKDSSSGTNTSNGSNTMSNETTGNSSVEGTTANTENATSTETTRGNYGQMSFQSLLKAYRDLIINIEKRIINDERIKELFMTIY